MRSSKANFDFLLDIMCMKLFMSKRQSREAATEAWCITKARSDVGTPGFFPFCMSRCVLSWHASLSCSFIASEARTHKSHKGKDTSEFVLPFSCLLSNMSLPSRSTVSLTSMSGTFLAALASIDDPEYMAVRQARHYTCALVICCH